MSPQTAAKHAAGDERNAMASRIRPRPHAARVRSQRDAHRAGRSTGEPLEQRNNPQRDERRAAPSHDPRRIPRRCHPPDEDREEEEGQTRPPPPGFSATDGSWPTSMEPAAGPPRRRGRMSVALEYAPRVWPDGKWTPNGASHIRPQHRANCGDPPPGRTGSPRGGRGRRRSQNSAIGEPEPG